jgi:hypothetical protein
VTVVETGNDAKCEIGQDETALLDPSMWRKEDDEEEEDDGG